MLVLRRQAEAKAQAAVSELEEARVAAVQAQEASERAHKQALTLVKAELQAKAEKLAQELETEKAVLGGQIADLTAQVRSIHTIYPALRIALLWDVRASMHKSILGSWQLKGDALTSAERLRAAEERIEVAEAASVSLGQKMAKLSADVRTRSI